MKLSGPLAAALLAIGAFAPVAAARIWFSEVPLEPPYNWIYGEKLGYRIIDVFDSPYENYTSSEWGEFIAQKCIDTILCQGTLTYTVHDNASKHRLAVTFRGPWLYSYDFERLEGIEDSVAENKVVD
ncbi:hypothetical protein EMCG_07219 [[Emmonsia] crescens]|uniref:Uncharacterized protein n=1 Tax=[Emmonsia] crescens TaxID=73230 RepID=A0A0G2J5W8_9EURO|nr:hypothetical protein EMCG_07219 [Emmonsia crescens UAMH 3008]